MQLSFDKAACQNTRRALRKEWLLTNGLGDYSSSSILYCNTRKYHGLLVAATPEGRAVLLSAMEESVVGAGKEFFISTRQHPGKLYPEGYQYMESFSLDPWPVFVYRVGDIRVKREMILLKGETRLLFRWTVEPRGTGTTTKWPELTLRLKPLLAFRGFHQLARQNNFIQPQARVAPGGFGISPYKGLPPLYFQVSGHHTFVPRPDWYHEIEYFQERERGFEDSEELFQPGILEIPFPALPEGGSVYMSVGTEELAEAGQKLAKMWDEDTRFRKAKEADTRGMIAHLQDIGEQYLVESASGLPEVIAGYHWFDSWGRDTLIALPGLTFYSGRTQFGLDVLNMVPGCMRNGLIPNIFGEENRHAYNSADASLWYAFAVQCFLKTNPDGYDWVRVNAWGALKEIVAGYKRGPGMDIYVDENGLLHAGNAETQLTWMDANSGGKPVTPRYGCPVELNALWYNTQAFVDELAKKFGEPEWECPEALFKMRKAFFEHFWVSRDGGYLGDVWRDGMLDQSIRPNQILAVGLPHRLLFRDHCRQVVDCVKTRLLTPYGLRTLSPSDPNYKSRYEGSPDERDAAYHQGTVWPWLLGQYTAALIRTTWDNMDEAVKSLLDTVTPLFTEHLADAGLGAISEIFDASPPFRPNGTISQAWSVGECLRMLIMLRDASPSEYAKWEEKVAKLLEFPSSGDTAGVGRFILKLENLANADGK